MKAQEPPPDGTLPETPADDAYQAPDVEAVMTPEDLEREVLYGGGDGTPVVCL